jgi:dTMP kinase
MPAPHPGTFVVLEGGEGSGKTKLILALEERLRDGGHAVVTTREPGGTQLGESIRGTLFSGKGERDPLAELLLFEAARAQLVAEAIKPALQQGAVILCDRFSASSIAYQSAGRGLPRDLVEDANRIATQGLSPDLTFLLDVSPETGLRRRTTDGDVNHFDTETMAFHERVRECFRELASEDPARWHTIDAEMDFATVLTNATARLETLLTHRATSST